MPPLDNRPLIGDQVVNHNGISLNALAFRSSKIEANVKRNYFEYEESESGEQLLRPLIYAVTADISQDAIDRI